MIDVLEPQNQLLKQFIDSIYIFKKSDATFEFTAYPSTNTPIALFRNSGLTIQESHVYIENSKDANYLGMACNQFSSSIDLNYLQLVDEIAINFKPLGFASFTKSKMGEGKLFRFNDWDEFLPGLFNNVFNSNKKEQQLLYIEALLLERYKPLTNEKILLKTLELLNDTSVDYRMQEIADITGLHYKKLYRSFTDNVGCSPAHYRKLVKFRSSVVSKIKKGDNTRLVDICYNYDYSKLSYCSGTFIPTFIKATPFPSTPETPFT